MKRITITLTEDQIRAIIRDVEFEMIDRTDTAYEQRLVNKLYKALAEAKS